MLFQVLFAKGFPLKRLQDPELFMVDDFLRGGEIEAPSAPHAFLALQLGTETPDVQLNMQPWVRSFSAGDALVSEDQVYLCLSRGWAVFPVPENMRAGAG